MLISYICYLYVICVNMLHICYIHVHVCYIYMLICYICYMHVNMLHICYIHVHVYYIYVTYITYMLHMSLHTKSNSKFCLTDYTNIVILNLLKLGIEKPKVPLCYHNVMYSKISPSQTR
jgi:hypothetical protein